MRFEDPEGRFRLVVADDRMSVSLETLKLDDPKRLRERALAGLAEMGVRHGLSELLLDAAVSSASSSEPHVVAKGSVPLAGEDGSWEALASPEERTGPEQKLDGTVDFHHLGRFREVAAGHPLASHNPPKPGVAGVDCFGEPVPAPAPKDSAWKLGPGTCPAPDNPDLVVASLRGILVRRDGTLAVEDKLQIAGSVDYSTGDIEVSVPVAIAEDVKPGFCVRSKAGVTVGGCVQSARVEAGGEIVVQGGVLGDPPSEIRTGKKLSAGYINNARVQVGGDVEVRRSAVDCAVSCGGRLLAGEKLIGSQVVAEAEVSVGSLGSELGAPSRVFVGLSSAARRRLYPVLVRRLDLQKEFLETEIRKQDLARTASREAAVSGTGQKGQKSASAETIDLDALRELSTRQEAIQEALFEMETKESEILRDAPADGGGAKLRVGRSVLPGTIIAIGSEKLQIENPLEGNRTIGASELRRGRMRILAVGSDSFLKEILTWSQGLGLWGLRLHRAEEDWALATKSYAPEYLFVEGRVVKAAAWETFRALSGEAALSGALFLLFAEGLPEDSVKAWESLPRALVVSGKPGAAVLAQLGQKIGF